MSDMPNSGGFLARWENITEEHGFKKFVNGRNSEYRTWDYLKPCADMPAVSEFNPVSSLSETKFHRGFFRRPHDCIQQESIGLTMEAKNNRQSGLGSRPGLRISSNSHSQYNILTHTGCERPGGHTDGTVRMFDLSSDSSHLFPDRAREIERRAAHSEHRYFTNSLFTGKQRSSSGGRAQPVFEETHKRKGGRLTRNVSQIVLG